MVYLLVASLVQNDITQQLMATTCDAYNHGLGPFLLQTFTRGNNSGEANPSCFCNYDFNIFFNLNCTLC